MVAPHPSLPSGTIPQASQPVEVRDELQLIRRLLQDQLRNAGLIPQVFEDGSVQLTRFPVEHQGQNPSIYIFSSNFRIVRFGMTDDEIVSTEDGSSEELNADIYAFTVNFHIQVSRHTRILYNNETFDDADRVIVLIRDVLLQIIRENTTHYDTESELEFGWFSATPTTANYLTQEGTDIVALDLFVDFLFQKAFKVQAENFELGT